MAAATLVNNNNQSNMDHDQPMLTDAKIFGIAVEEDESVVYEIADAENKEKEAPVKSSVVSVPIRQASGLSMTSSATEEKNTTSKAYRYIQLERALKSANLLKKKDDQVKFEGDYLSSKEDNKFDEFINNYYRKIDDHNQHLKEEEEFKKTRMFTFMDLEKKFLALDPTRDIKIIFVDEPTESTITRTTHTHSTTSGRHRSTSSAITNDAAIELFYANRSERFLTNPSQAREEITVFARRTAERLHERLPRISSVPHRVKIVDDRDTTGKPDENVILQMKHKHVLSSLTKRRHLILKMVQQSRKNQKKMNRQWTQTPLVLDNAACCRELLERASQIEEDYVPQVIRRPQTAFISRKTPGKIASSSVSDITTKSTNPPPSVTSTSTSTTAQHRDVLSINHMEKMKNIRVLVSNRPVTASTKANWVNYC